MGDGTEDSYSFTGGLYVAPAGVYDVLVKNANGTWKLTKKGGSALNFDSSWVLTSLVDTNGNTTSLAYIGANLTSVTDPAGRSLTLAYAAGKLASVTDIQSRTWSFAYDASGRPATISHPPLAGQTYTQAFA